MSIPLHAPRNEPWIVPRNVRSSAACITNVGAVVEGAEAAPHKVGGFHVLQVYGDHVKKLRAWCQLQGIEAVHSWDPRCSFDFEPNCA